MRLPQRIVRNTIAFHAYLVVAAAMITLQSAAPIFAAIAWDGGAGTKWWYDSVNWNTNGNNNYWLPPSQGTQLGDYSNNGVVDAADYVRWRNGGGTLANESETIGVIDNDDYTYWRGQFGSVQTAPTATDILINVGTGSIPGGEGVVYDPANDPNFAVAAAKAYPPTSYTGVNYSPQRVSQFYLSRATTTTNMLTIKGDLEVRGSGSLGPVVGRSSGTAGVGTDGIVIQTGGFVNVYDRPLDLGATDTSNPGYGNGTWDYRGGSLEVSFFSGAGLRLSTGGSAGTGGYGKFIMHNPTTPGYVRPYSMNIAAHAATANGTTFGVGIVEFHYENGNTRPIQVVENLTINNGTETGGQVRSARLDLKLDAAPILTAGVPQDLGLFDVDFLDPDILGDPTGNIVGSGSNAQRLSNADGTVVYTPDSIVSAVFGSTVYNWKISYVGNITWDGSGDTGLVTAISNTGGKDIVLIGFSSGPAGSLTGVVPEPSSILLLAGILAVALGRRQR